MIVNTINKFIFSRPTIVSLLTIPGRDFDSPNDADAPIYPINEQPESEAPYVIYGWKTLNWYPEYYIQRDEITYSIWDINIGRLQQLEDELRRYLGQAEVSAEAITMWQRGNGDCGSYAVKNMRYMGSTNPWPETQEGGVVGKNLIFRVDYVDLSLEQPLDYS